MDSWPLRLLSAIAMALALVGASAIPAHARSSCSDLQRQTVGCPDQLNAQVEDDSLLLGGSTSNLSEPRSGHNDAHRDGTERIIESRPDPVEDGAYLPGCPDIQFDPSNCIHDAPAATPPQDTPGPAPAITLDDLASFSPRADRLSAEPGDWAIAGLAVNPVADDAPATASGELLGLPAEVRFTPVEFLWDHGDGSTLSTPDGGATWADLGQAEFSDTATSHVYERPGTYTLSLSVRFAAEYSVGGGPWTPVAGTLVAESGAFEITVGSAGTVLVDRDCRTGVRGPGC